MTDPRSPSDWQDALPKDLPLQEFALRGVRADLARQQLFDPEVRQLEGKIEGQAALQYVCWRRSAIWIALAALAIALVFGLISFVEALGRTDEDLYRQFSEAQIEQAEKSMKERGLSSEKIAEAIRKDVEKGAPLIRDLNTIGSSLETLLFLATAGAVAFLAMAGLRWDHIESSRKALRFALLSALGVPLACSLVPWNMMVDAERLEGLGQRLQDVEQFRTATGLLVAMTLFTKVGPAVIGMCAGVIRGAMTLKTLLPESFLPGWTVLAFAPVYAVLMITVIVLVHQMQGDLVLLLGVGALIASPMSYVLMGEGILAPMSGEEASSKIQEGRKRATGFYLLGAVLISIWMFESTDLGVVDAISFLFSAIGTALLISTAAADLQIQLIGSSWRQLDDLKSSELADNLEHKLEELSGADLA